MSDEFYQHAWRSLRRRRLLGDDAACVTCGCTDIVALHRDRSGMILCYECTSLHAGRSTIERHHPIGRVLDETIEVGGNLHRVLSDAQTEWPAPVRNNPTRDPLAIIAAALLAVSDVARVAPATEGTAVRRCLDWLADHAHRFAAWLVLLAKTLRQGLGDEWWHVLELPDLLPDARIGKASDAHA